MKSNNKKTSSKRDQSEMFASYADQERAVFFPVVLSEAQMPGPYDCILVGRPESGRILIILFGVIELSTLTTHTRMTDLGL
jgi:hypothetical protein